MGIEDKSVQQRGLLKDDEIDVFAIVKTLWGGRKIVVKTTLLFMFVGLFVALFSAEEYTSSTTMIPQTAQGMSIGGSLGGLAAMAGVNLNGMTNESGIPPTIYPLIIATPSFKKELLNTPLTIQGYNEKISYKKYFTKIHKPSVLGYVMKYTFRLPSLIKNKIFKKKSTEYSNQETKNNKLMVFSEKEEELFESLDGRLFIDYNEEEGLVRLTGKMPTAITAAEMTKATQELLQRYIIDFKNNKSKEELVFIKNRLGEKESEFLDIEERLAKFMDKNHFSTSSLSQIELKKLQSKYDITFDVFRELSKQYEAQLIKVKEDTPVFMILEKVYIPIQRSKPRRFFVLITYSFVGIVFGFILSLRRTFIGGFKEKWDNY